MYTMAEIGVALAGFAAIVIALRQKEGASLTDGDRKVVASLIERGLVAAMLSFLPILLDRPRPLQRDRVVHLQRNIRAVWCFAGDPHVAEPQIRYQCSPFGLRPDLQYAHGPGFVGGRLAVPACLRAGTPAKRVVVSRWRHVAPVFSRLSLLFRASRMDPCRLTNQLIQTKI